MKITHRQQPVFTNIENISHQSSTRNAPNVEAENKFESAPSLSLQEESANYVRASQLPAGQSKTLFQTMLSPLNSRSSSKSYPSSLCLDAGVAERLYQGKDLRVTVSERAFLDQGDLRSFWNARLGKDPVARLGVALWGESSDIKHSIESQPKEYWTPTANIATKAAMFFKAPSHVKTPPSNNQEKLDYWTWMGTTTHERVENAIDKAHPHLSKTEKKDLVREIGIDIAKAHVKALDKDALKGKGIPNLLDSKQIADYHHEVFESYGLPASTYGGTPSTLIPDFLELHIASGLYAHDADR